MLQLYAMWCNTYIATTAKMLKEEHKTPRIVNFCRNKCIGDAEEGFPRQISLFNETVDGETFA